MWRRTHVPSTSSSSASTSSSSASAQQQQLLFEESLGASASRSMVFRGKLYKRTRARWLLRDCALIVDRVDPTRLVLLTRKSGGTRYGFKTFTVGKTTCITDCSIYFTKMEGYYCVEFREKGSDQGDKVKRRWVGSATEAPSRRLFNALKDWKASKGVPDYSGARYFASLASGEKLTRGSTGSPLVPDAQFPAAPDPVVETRKRPVDDLDACCVPPSLAKYKAFRIITTDADVLIAASNEKGKGPFRVLQICRERARFDRISDALTVLPDPTSESALRDLVARSAATPSHPLAQVRLRKSTRSYFLASFVF